MPDGLRERLVRPNSEKDSKSSLKRLDDERSFPLVAKDQGLLVSIVNNT